MVEGSPRRVSVASHEATIKMSLSEEEVKPMTLPHKKSHDKVRKTESAPPNSGSESPGSSRWKKLRTTVQLGNAVYAHHKKPPLKREDSFLQRFSTRPPNTPTNPSQPTQIFHFTTVLNPDESLLFWWLWVVTLCGLHNSWTLIVRQAFPELQEAHPTLWKVLDICSDVAYLLDIVVQFRTGYLEQGIMVRDGTRLARHYVTSRDFFLDVAALVPLDFMHGVVGESPLLRFPRFLKARRIYKFYYAVESRTAYPNLWRVANLIHVLLLLAHWFGCFYYMLSELEGFQGSWAYRHPEREESPLVRKYLGSVYWSTLTLTTIGDLATPATNLQYLFTIISYLIGVFIFATIVGQVGNVITNRNASRLEFERLLDGAKLYMRHHKVPKGMQRRVQRWYDYSWSRGRMQGGGDIHSALGILPDKLKTELAIHVNLKTLKKVSIFQECQPEFLHDLVLKMKAYIFTPGDLVCRKGEVAREMFIIADGILQVIKSGYLVLGKEILVRSFADKNQYYIPIHLFCMKLEFFPVNSSETENSERGLVLTQMKAGDFFGEIGILNLDGFNRRTADVRSVGYSELFSLSREDVLSAMKDYPEAEEILQSMGRKRLMEARMTNNADSSDKIGSLQPDGQRPDSHRGSIESRQRKKGISLAYLLKGKKEGESDISSQPQQKFSSVSFISEGSKGNGSKEHSFSELVNKFHQVRQRTIEDGKLLPNHDDAPGMSSFIDRIIHKQSKMSPLPMRRKRSLWFKLSRFVHLRHWRTSNIELVPEQSESKINHCSKLPKTETQSYPSSKKPLSPVDNRRTSWQPSKPSVSNWNRSELFTNSSEKTGMKKRRKTIAESGMLLKTNLCHEKPQKQLPGILMTGSGLNVKNESPDISPMSSNYSLTPSTSEEENNENDGQSEKESALHKDFTEKISIDKVPVFPSGASDSMQQFVTRIVCDFKATMDTYIAETERDMCLRIIQLEEEIKLKDATIKDLQQQIVQQERRDSEGIHMDGEVSEPEEEEEEEEEEGEEEEEPVEEPSPTPSPQNKISQDSAICSIDVTSPSPHEPGSDVHFEEEEMWLVEFPQNVPTALAVKRPELRRHSSVEVGHEIPFRLATQKSDDTYLIPTTPREGATSPRRFSESQARPEVVLNNSFAARVRRVFAKVKANRLSEEAAARSLSPPGSFKWPTLTTTTKPRRSSTGSSGGDKRQQLQLQRYDESLGGDSVKRLLPTIAESCSFDSLRESPMMELKLHTEPTASTESKDSVVIDISGETAEQST